MKKRTSAFSEPGVLISTFLFTVEKQKSGFNYLRRELKNVQPVQTYKKKSTCLVRSHIFGKVELMSGIIQSTSSKSNTIFLILT